MIIKAIKPRNKKLLNKEFEAVKGKDNSLSIKIGRTEYIAYPETKTKFNGYDSIEEQAADGAGICFHKVDSNNSSMVWFDKFEVA